VCCSYLGNDLVEPATASSLVGCADLGIDQPSCIGEVLSVAPAHVPCRGGLLQPSAGDRSHGGQHPIPSCRFTDIGDQQRPLGQGGEVEDHPCTVGTDDSSSISRGH